MGPEGGSCEGLALWFVCGGPLCGSCVDPECGSCEGPVCESCARGPCGSRVRVLCVGRVYGSWVWILGVGPVLVLCGT